MTPSTLSSGSGQWTGGKGFQNSTSSSGVGCSAAPTVRVGKRRRANRGRGRSAMVVAGCALRGNEGLLHDVELETQVGQSGAGGDLRAVGDLAWPAS